MFGTFRRHQKWIWILGVIVIIPSFVIFFTPDLERRWLEPGSGGGSGAYMIGDKAVTLKGKALTKQQISDAVKETQLSYFIRSNGQEWRDADESLRREAIFRVFLVHRIEDMDIAVSAQAVAQSARDRLQNYPYERFEREVLRRHGLTTEDFERFSKNEAALQQLLSAASLSAMLMTPAEAEFIYRQENRDVQLEVAAFWNSNYLSQVEATPEQISTFYTNSMARYRIPERIEVSYVAFEATNFLSKAVAQINEVTNVAQQLTEMYYQRGGTNTFVDTNGVALSEEVAKAQILESEQFKVALNMAHQAANDFGNELLSQANPNDPQNLDRLAAARELPVHVTQPFSFMEGFEGQGLPEDFKQVALQLNTNQAVAATSPVRGTNAIYIMAYKNKLPPRIQPFEEVQEKVQADYKNGEAFKLVRSSVTNFHAILTNSMAQDKSFADVAAEQKVELVPVPPFAATTSVLTNLDPRLELRRLQALSKQIEPGEVSGPQFLREGAIVVYYRAQLPIDPERMGKELPDLLNRLRFMRRNEAFNQWLGREVQREQLTIPEPPQPAQPGAPGAPSGLPPGARPASRGS